jgi:hypothetical protein
VSDDAAQKRVSRALERLRAEFNRRGVTTTAVALSAAVSANAVSAPAGLAAALSTAALTGTTLTTTATATATKAIAMTTLQKTLISATLAAAFGTGIYEARQASTLRTQVQTLQQQQIPPADQIQRLTRERDDATQQLAALRDDNDRLNRNTSEVLRLRAEVGRLRKPTEKEEPPKDHTTSATGSIQVPTNQTEFEEVKSQMTTALRRVGFTLREYMTNNPLGIIIDNSGQLNQNIFSNSVALPLDRFQILVRDVQHLASAIERNPKLVIAKSTSPIPFDGYYTHFYLTADGSVTATTLGLAEEPIKGGFLPSDKELSTLAEAQDPVRRVLLPALEAFAAANSGQRPSDPSQLQPYITTPEQQDFLKIEIEKLSLRNSVRQIQTNFTFATNYFHPSTIKGIEPQNSAEKP